MMSRSLDTDAGSSAVAKLPCEITHEIMSQSDCGAIARISRRTRYRGRNLGCYLNVLMN